MKTKLFFASRVDNLFKVVFLQIILIFSFISNAQIKTDSLQIIQLLQKEGLAWRMGDKEAHSNCWQERPYGKILVAPKDGDAVNVPVSFIMNPPEGMLGNGGFAVHSNHRFAIYENNAWVSHDEVSIDKFGKESHSYEIRMLEKINGNWKLVGQSILGFNPKKRRRKNRYN